VTIVPADLFLSATLTAEEASQYLTRFGFADPGTADTRLQALAEDPAVREALARVADLLLDAVQRAPDPDAALAAFVRHVEVRPGTVTFLEGLRADPRALGLLVDTAGRSPFVADALQRSPELLHWLVKEVDRPPPDPADLAEEAGSVAIVHADPASRDAALGRLHRRELLRVASRDVLGRETPDSVSAQLATLAEVTLGEFLRAAGEHVVERLGLAAMPGRVALLGLGRLGARELDYAPDVELLFVYEPHAEDDPDAHAVLRDVVQQASDALARAAAAGDFYRAELPARSAALSGAPAASLRRWQAYCAGLSDHRLRLAFVRASRVAGDAELCARALSVFGAYAYDSGPADGPLVDVRRRLASGEASADDDVRDGAGGIADLEEFTATMRLALGRARPELRVAGTREALGALARVGVLTDDESARLVAGLSLLRRVEQSLYLTRGEVAPTLEDPAALNLVAARLDVADADALRERLLAERMAIRTICRAALDRF